MRRAAAPLLTLLLTVTACSGGGTSAKPGPTLKQPPVAAFTAGPCRAMAPDLLAIERDATQVGSAAAPSESALGRLKDAQGRIRALQPSFAADKVLTPVVEDLVVAVGVVRLTAVSNVYKPSYAADAKRLAAAAITSCTSATPSPSPTR